MSAGGVSVVPLAVVGGGEGGAIVVLDAEVAEVTL